MYHWSVCVCVCSSTKSRYTQSKNKNMQIKAAPLLSLSSAYQWLNIPSFSLSGLPADASPHASAVHLLSSFSSLSNICSLFWNGVSFS